MTLFPFEDHREVMSFPHALYLRNFIFHIFNLITIGEQSAPCNTLRNRFKHLNEIELQVIQEVLQKI